MNSSLTTRNGVDRDVLIKSVLYSFAMCDYEGAQPIPLKSVSGGEIFDGQNIEVVNEALSTSQEEKLIKWDDEKIGWLRLTSAGRAAFMQVRDDFFDAEAVLSLQGAVEKIEIAQQNGPSAPIIRAKAGQSCPRSVIWRAQEASARQQRYRVGETMHDLRSPYGLTLWLWVSD